MSGWEIGWIILGSGCSLSCVLFTLLCVGICIWAARVVRDEASKIK